MRLLVIRISAMGDVALTTPVLAAMQAQHPDVELLMVTRESFRPFFSSINGILFFFPQLTGKHKGLLGILRLYKDIKSTSRIDKVVDLHDVLRSKILRSLFWLSGIPVYSIDKGRIEKRSVITGKKKVQLKHTVERYSDVFARAGFQLNQYAGKPIIPSADAISRVISLLNPDFELNIGVAPFAKHNLKMWPAGNMIRLLQLIREKHKCRFFLFGGKEDFEMMNEFEKNVPNISRVSGNFNLEEELALISKLDLMISMDSSNMHMAALTGTKVISIWGGTDPLTGFGAWRQPDSYSIRIPVEELDCRPCTIYGKGETRNDFACMKRLTPESVLERMNKLGIW
jgi:ADP-heptose:LPS heptosyltransferase